MGESWYVIEAFEGRDEDVALRLCAAGFKAWRPIDEVRTSVRDRATRSRRPQRRVVKRARFGRYLFLRADLSDFVMAAVRGVRGVRDFVLAAGSESPAVVQDELIEFYRSFRPDRDRNKANAAIIKKADVVKILAGPFEGWEGRVEDIDKRGVARVLTNIFGRPTPLIIEVGHVELSGAGRRPPTTSSSKRCSGHRLVQMA